MYPVLECMPRMFALVVSIRYVITTEEIDYDCDIITFSHLNGVSRWLLLLCIASLCFFQCTVSVFFVSYLLSAGPSHRHHG